MAKKIDLTGLGFFKSQENGMVASEYSSSSTYAVGDYSYHSGTLYRCIVPITTAEAWTSGHWTAAKLAEDVTAQSDRIDAQSEQINDSVIADITVTKQGGYINNDGTVTLDPSNTYYYVSQGIDVSSAGKIRVGNYYTATSRPTVTILNSSGTSVARIVNPGSGLTYVELDIPDTGVIAYVQATSSLNPTVTISGSYSKIKDGMLSAYLVNENDSI